MKYKKVFEVHDSHIYDSFCKTGLSYRELEAITGIDSGNLHRLLNDKMVCEEETYDKVHEAIFKTLNLKNLRNLSKKIKQESQ